MSLFTKFNHSLSFKHPDPLGDGLGDAIAAEQAESEAINLEEVPDTASLIDQWNHMVEDIEHDPNFSFAGEEE